MLQKRKLGTQGLVVSEQGLGCMGMSEFYGPRDDAESLRTIARALELGGDFLATADGYGPLRHGRLRGAARSPAGKFLGSDGRPEDGRARCDASLEPLGVDVIDLYYQHRVDPKPPI